MTLTTDSRSRYTLKEPLNLSERVRWLRDYYFEGVKRNWNNEFTAWTTGTTVGFSIQRDNFLHRP